jgi:predicted TIM-barrel fold metal-dependent hydrolase
MTMSIMMPEFSHPPIDIHSHFNHGSPFDCPQTPIHYRTLEFIKTNYGRFGIPYVGMSTYASVLHHPECVYEENEYLHRLVAETDWMYQWVVIDPRQEKTYAQAEKMLDHPKVLGIKIHPHYHGYDILDYADQLFAFAEKHKTVVLMHHQHILEMAKFANKYPSMKLIIAHLGSMEHIEAVSNAENGNVYVDTSAGDSSINNIIEYAVSRLGSEKILFGTDTYACSYAYPRIALADLPIEDKENILWKNALRLFPGSFQ